MRWPYLTLVALLTATLTLRIVAAANDDKEIYRITPTSDPSAPFGVYVPADLDDAFKELSRMLHPKMIERMKTGTETNMVQYHFGLGMWMRNNWALWKGSRLSTWFNQKGVHHPDDMSGIILTSFWRHLNSRPIELDVQVKQYEEYWEKAKEAQEREKQRAKNAEQQIGNLMMGMSLATAQVERIRTLPRSQGYNGGLRARYLAQYRGGVLLTIRKGFKEDFTTPGYFLNLKSKEIHPVKVPEIQDLQSAVVAGDVAYFSGTTNGTPLLVSVGSGNRSVLTLPVESSSPQLGTDGANLLAVYKNAIYVLGGTQWTEIFRGNITLPRSGPLPQKSGNTVFFRDEGRGENEKRLWWLELTQMPTLVSLDQDIGVVGPEGPRWENSYSYCITPAGDLWATMGEGYAKKSLVKRSANGTYSLAIVHNSVRFDGTLLGSKGSDDGLSVSAVAMGKNGSMLAASDRGLYTIQDKQIKQLLAFEIIVGGGISRWSWDPSDILELDGENYIVSGAFGGIYMITREESGRHTMTALDETIGEPITF